MRHPIGKRSSQALAGFIAHIVLLSQIVRLHSDFVLTGRLLPVFVKDAMRRVYVKNKTLSG